MLDHFHLVMLADTMVTDVRPRLLLRGGDQFSAKALRRLNTVFDTDDPTDHIHAAWECKELLRKLLTACVDADMPETTRRSGTIEKW